MSNRWITKKNKDGEKKRVRIEDSKVHGTKLKRIPPETESQYDVKEKLALEIYTKYFEEIKNKVLDDNESQAYLYNT